ncbi:MAG: nicotinate (nicotinamide) nucleotide adenylyltransferase [Cytophagales bacterium]|nr:nicotinate (nicotinamide) nucleotide adenylyltransferase [Cytophagales bacterium]MDW8384254.1 nicotinate (nicotinamide) nucleotide adenylyltransferase [Flammeovirgaceae bacterium]
MKIGLFFGSFNPIHIGHLIIAETIKENSDVQQVWFVVSPHNPLKSKSGLLHAFDRLNMVRLAIADNPHFRVSDIELHLPEPNYTIHTLTYLSEKYPQHEFQLIMGQDNLEHFHKWKNYQEILHYYTLLVYPRPGAKPNELIHHPHVKLIEAPLLDISATFIRKQLQQGKSVKYLLHPDVESFIRFKKFYQ